MYSPILTKLKVFVAEGFCGAVLLFKMPPNFSGTWLNTKTEGDCKKFFKQGLEMGCPMLQLAGCCFNYGTGKLTHIIEQEGESKITVTQTWPDKVTTTFEIDGQLHDGRTVAWEGDKLVITPGPNAKSDAFINTQRRRVTLISAVPVALHWPHEWEPEPARAAPPIVSVRTVVLRRWMQGDELVTKFSFGSSKPGVEITRYFTRQAQPTNDRTS